MDSTKARKVVQNAINSITPNLTEGRNSFTLEDGVEVVINVPQKEVESHEESWWESSEEYWDDSGC